MLFVASSSTSAQLADESCSGTSADDADIFAGGEATTLVEGGNSHAASCREPITRVVQHANDVAAWTAVRVPAV